MLLFYTIRMKTNSSDNTDSRWQKRPWQILFTTFNQGTIMREFGFAAS